jgi:hypothetical protein
MTAPETPIDPLPGSRPTRHLLRIFVTGLLAALPLAATVAIFWWAANLLIRWLGPDSLVGGALAALGLGVTGSEVAGYAIGVALVAAAIFVLGLLVEAGLQRGLARMVDAVLERIPLVRSVYDLSRRIVGLISQRDGAPGMNSMSAVWCHFGPPCWGCSRRPSRCGSRAAPMSVSSSPPHRCRWAAACSTCRRTGCARPSWASRP